jgi:hypothetical protein
MALYHYFVKDIIKARDAPIESTSDGGARRPILDLQTAL